MKFFEVDHCPALLDDEIHVWRVDIRESRPFSAAKRLEKRFILQRVLGGYLGLPPEMVVIRRTAFGKPFVANSEGVCFSSSDVGDRLVVAVMRGSMLGTDVELMISDDLGDVTGLYFASVEREQLDCLKDVERVEAWFTLWTLKEAYAKLLGSGLTEKILNTDMMALLRSRADLHFASFEPWPGYMAAVVYEGASRQVCSFDGSL